jgi:hypothetical protein
MATARTSSSEPAIVMLQLRSLGIRRQSIILRAEFDIEASRLYG